MCASVMFARTRQRLQKRHANCQVAKQYTRNGFSLYTTKRSTRNGFCPGPRAPGTCHEAYVPGHMPRGICPETYAPGHMARGICSRACNFMPTGRSASFHEWLNKRSNQNGSCPKRGDPGFQEKEHFDDGVMMELMRGFACLAEVHFKVDVT